MNVMGHFEHDNMLRGEALVFFFCVNFKKKRQRIDFFLVRKQWSPTRSTPVDLPCRRFLRQNLTASGYY